MLIIMLSNLVVKAQLFTYDTLFAIGPTHRLSLSPENECWLIKDNDKRSIAKINQTDQILDFSAQPQSLTASHFTDIQTTRNGNVFIGTYNDNLIHYNSSTFKKSNLPNGLRSSNINSLHWTGKYGYAVTYYNSSFDTALVAGTDRGIFIAQNEDTVFKSNSLYNNDSAAVVYGSTLNSIYYVVKHFRSNFCSQGNDRYRSNAVGNIQFSNYFSDASYIENDSIEAFAQVYPFYYTRDDDAAISMAYWGTKNGLRRRPWNCTFGGTLKDLPGIPIHKIFQVRFYPSGTNFSQIFVLVGSEDGLYYCNGSVSLYEDLKNDSIIFIPETLGFKIYDIDIDSCNSKVWLATDKGVMRLHMNYSFSVSSVTGIKQLTPAGPHSVCLGDTIVLRASSLINSQYQWQKNNVSIVNANKAFYNATEPGDYRVIYTYWQYCRPFVDTSYAVRLFTDTTNCKTLFPDTVKLCENENYRMEACSLTGKSMTYHWYRNNAIMNNDASFLIVNQPGNYYVAVNNCNAQSSISDTLVVEYPYLPSAEIIPLSSYEKCIGDSILLETQDGDYKIEWFKDGMMLNGDTLLTAYTSGSYRLKYSKSGCESYSDPVSLIFHEVSDVHIYNSKNNQICEGDTLVLQAENQSSNYRWSTSSNEKNIKVSEPGWYKVESIDINDCYSKDSVYVNVFANPTIELGNDTVFCEGYLKPITLQVPPLFAKYIWNGDSTFGNVYNAYYAGNYKLEVIDENNCRTSDTVTIFNDCPVIFIPNLITPNNDGLNDVFEIVGLLPKSSLKIYNSYGAIIYSNENYANDWSGETLASGVYYYEFISSYHGSINKGWLHVIK